MPGAQGGEREQTRRRTRANWAGSIRRASLKGEVASMRALTAVVLEELEELEDPDGG